MSPAAMGIGAELKSSSISRCASLGHLFKAAEHGIMAGCDATLGPAGAITVSDGAAKHCRFQARLPFLGSGISTHLRIWTINTGGLQGTWRMVNLIGELPQDQRPEVLCIQETSCSDQQWLGLQRVMTQSCETVPVSLPGSCL